MTEKDQLALFRAALFQIAELAEQLVALRLALMETGVTAPAQMEAALERAREVWKPFREQIERLEIKDVPNFDDILSKFQGPIQ